MTESNGKCLFELEGYCCSWIDYPDFKCKFWLDPVSGDNCGKCNAKDSDLMTEEEWNEIDRKKMRDEIIAIVNSPETRKRGEELHKALSVMTVKDYWRNIR